MNIVKVKSVVCINGCILSVYRGFDAEYRFSIIDLSERPYVCNSSFSEAGHAELMGVAVIKLAMLK